MQSVTDYYSPSDHFPTEAKFKINLKRDNNKEKDESGKWKGAEKREETHRLKFEQAFVTYYKKTGRGKMRRAARNRE